MTTYTGEPEHYFFADDGQIPNSKYPLLLYRKVFPETGKAAADWFEERFAENNWTNSWRNGVFPFHHYHSTSHEVLGVYRGWAVLQLGGEQGNEVRVEAGDAVVIPAGVGHKNIQASADFGVVGAYPDGRSYDTLRGAAGERPRANLAIAAVPLPRKDPLLGERAGLVLLWQKK